MVFWQQQNYLSITHSPPFLPLIKKSPLSICQHSNIPLSSLPRPHHQKSKPSRPSSAFNPLRTPMKQLQQASLFDINIVMLNRSNVSLAESQLKLEEIQRQLKVKLQKAREIAATCCSDENSDRTTEQLYNELQNLEMPEFNPNTNYNDEYWKTYLQNQINCALIREISDKKSQLTELISQIQNLQDEHYRLNRIKNRKKNRRLAAEIEKNFLCPYDKCHRIYGSDVSLNLHIKLKHNGGNKTDRQKLAQKICAAEENKLPPPPLTLNLPPGYLREYRKLYFQRDFAEPDFSHLQNYAVKKQIAEDSSSYL